MKFRYGLYMTSSILILGGGAMGGAIARQWQNCQLGPLHLVEPDAKKREEFSALGIATYAELSDVPPSISTLLLAIKPQQFASIKNTLGVQFNSSPLLLSIMAGIPLAELKTISKNAVRIMPNLPAQIGESMSVAYAPNLSELHRAHTTTLLEAIGKLAWVEDEELLHAATAISGSGPGYLFAFMEALELAAIQQGLPSELVHTLVCQTVRGAGLLADHSGESVTVLRQRVTSPNGTTQAALDIFAKHDFTTLVNEAVEAAIIRSRALAKSV